MSQKVPMDRFQWENLTTWTTKDVLNFNSNGDVGLILEVDVDIPSEIHDATADYPLCPDPLLINETLISPYSRYTSDFISPNMRTYKFKPTSLQYCS